MLLACYRHSSKRKKKKKKKTIKQTYFGTYRYVAICFYYTTTLLFPKLPYIIFNYGGEGAGK